MSTNFPTSLDALSNPLSTDFMDTVPHSTQHANANDAIEALQAKVGIDGSSDVNSLEYKVTQANPLTTKGDIFVRSSSGNTRLPVGIDGYMLVADSAETTGLKYITPSSGGTVTTTSVVSANGLTGTVANATTTPAITLSTTVTGVLKGNGTAISAASAGTDYYAPGGTDVSVADGGTGVSSLTAYAPIFGGTTGTGAVQSGAVGTTGDVLTSNGASAIATFQPLNIYTSVTQYQKVSTGTVTPYSFTLNGGILGTSKCVEIEITFSGLQSSGGGSTATVTLNIGSDLLSLTPTIPLDGNTYNGVFKFLICGNGGTSAQRIIGRYIVGYNNNNYCQHYVTSTTSAFDSTSNQTVNIKYTSGTSGAQSMTSEIIKVTRI